MSPVMPHYPYVFPRDIPNPWTREACSCDDNGLEFARVNVSKFVIVLPPSNVRLNRGREALRPQVHPSRVFKKNPQIRNALLCEKYSYLLIQDHTEIGTIFTSVCSPSPLPPIPCTSATPSQSSSYSPLQCTDREEGGRGDRRVGGEELAGDEVGGGWMFGNGCRKMKRHVFGLNTRENLDGGRLRYQTHSLRLYHPPPL